MKTPKRGKVRRFRKCHRMTSVVDPHHLDADPDSTYHPDTDPDSDFLFDADPDPTFHPDADPDSDPSFKKKTQTLEKVLI
jgi:hypothetical protein